MEGIQKSVYLGLKELASEVEEGLYGTDDDAFDDDGSNSSNGQRFLDQMHDLIIDRMV